MNKEQLSEWRQHPQTLDAFRALEQIILDRCIAMGSGDRLVMDSVNETALSIAREVGFIDGLRQVMSLEIFEDE